MATSSAYSARLQPRTNGREKAQLSCTFCRRRKLRCDRQKPCESCKRLGQASTCQYPASHLLQVQGGRQANQTSLQGRIDHLEALVRSMSEKQQNHVDSLTPPGHQDSVLPAITAPIEIALKRDFGSMHLHEHESSYVESDHWMAILDEISDLKDVVKEKANIDEKDGYEQIPKLPGADLFLSKTSPMSKLDILSTIPPRPLVDSMVAKYFKIADMPVALAVHRRVFFKQYENFWESPDHTPIMWITILYGMMYFVAYCAIFVEGLTLDEETMAEYQGIVTCSREIIIQCLRLGNYMKGTPHTIEALLTLLQLEYIQGEDSKHGCWQLVGVIIRVAMRMGYHRDGSHFPEISVFEAEMRRRIWYLITQFDIASSSVVGLPCMVRKQQCDAVEPRNLQDDDFDDTYVTLPPERPQTEHTLVQFLVYKSRIVSVYGMICDLATSSKQKDYHEVMRLEKLLKTVYNSTPPILQYKTMQSSIMDGAELIARRLYIKMSYHHAQMTLHRKFMILAKSNDKYAFSHASCIKTALTVLQLQVELHEQCQPGRMLHADRWKILTLIQSEILLAATILCFNVHDDMENQRWETTALFSLELHQQICTALSSSRAIWFQQQDFSKDAQTAVKAIDYVLKEAQSVMLTSDQVLFSCVNALSDTYPTPRVFTDSFIDLPTSSEGGLNVEQSGTQAEFEDAAWSQIFDIDQMWDSWLEI